MATYSSILVWKIPWTEEPRGHSPWGHKESDTIEHVHTHTHTHTHTPTLLSSTVGLNGRNLQSGGVGSRLYSPLINYIEILLR